MKCRRKIISESDTCYEYYKKRVMGQGWGMCEVERVWSGVVKESPLVLVWLVQVWPELLQRVSRLVESGKHPPTRLQLGE